MVQATEAVQSNKIDYLKVSKEFSVPKTSLKRKVKSQNKSASRTESCWEPPS